MTKPKKPAWKNVYIRFEKLAKRLKKERKELDANEFWKFLILELSHQRQEIVEEIEKRKKYVPQKVGEVSTGEMMYMGRYGYNQAIDDILAHLKEK